MASGYPGAVDNFTQTFTDTTSESGVHPQHHNDLADAIKKIETELGLLPKGSFASVRARLDAARILPFSRSGALAVVVGQGRFYFPFAATILGVQASVGTQPTGSGVIVDVDKNGTTIFTTQANRPTISAATNVSAIKVPDITTYAIGDYMSVDVDQIGSTVSGSDLTVVIQYAVL